MSLTLLKLYRANGFAGFQSCSGHHDRKLVVWFSIEAYGRQPDFSMLCGKYLSNVQNSKREKVLFWPRKGGRGDISLLRSNKNRGGGWGTPFLP